MKPKQFQKHPNLEAITRALTRYDKVSYSPGNMHHETATDDCMIPLEAYIDMGNGEVLRQIDIVKLTFFEGDPHADVYVYDGQDFGLEPDEEYSSKLTWDADVGGFIIELLPEIEGVLRFRKDFLLTRPAELPTSPGHNT